MKLMKNYKLIAGVALLMLTAGTQAATSISPYVTVFDVKTFNTAKQTLAGVNGSSWVSETMGYLGWTHFSKWGFVDLKKGQNVTIELDGTAVKGLHPAVSVWFRTSLKKANDASLYYMDDHFYNQFQSVSILGAVDDTTKLNVGDINRTFIANAVDRDGLGDYITVGTTTYGPYLPANYDQSGFNKVIDGVPGKVALTFTVPTTGVYQFVVGALKPDAGSDASLNAGKMTGNKHSIDVTVKVN